VIRPFLMPLATLARTRAKTRKARRVDAETIASEAAASVVRSGWTEYLRYYDTTMKSLADRGHHVMVAVNALQERKHARLDLMGDERIAILGEFPERSGSVDAAGACRARDDGFRRYFHPRFADAPALRHRMYRKVLPGVLRPLDRIRTLSEPSLARVMRVLQMWERAVPISPGDSRVPRSTPARRRHRVASDRRSVGSDGCGPGRTGGGCAAGARRSRAGTTSPTRGTCVSCPIW
jgi:hypothetical protein